MPAQRPGKSAQDWETPPELINALCSRLQVSTFTWDLAASAENAKAKFFFTEADNALTKAWNECGGWLWCNPPYADIAPWVEKAASEAQAGANIAMLVPASVGANWWRDYVHRKAQVLLLNGRITFVGATGPYPKDCALLLYTPFIKEGGYEVWSWKDQPTSDNA